MIAEAEISEAILGTVVRDQEEEIKRLTGRTLELELALEDAGLLVPPGDGSWRLAMFRKLLIVRDLSLVVAEERGSPKALARARADLLRVIEESFALTPVCRNGDHA